MNQRKLDTLRRITIPQKFFERLDFSINQKVEITIEYGEICIKKYEPKNIQIRPYIGIVREVDLLHRVVIPAEYLCVLGMKPNDPIQVRLEEGIIKAQKKLI